MYLKGENYNVLPNCLAALPARGMEILCANIQVHAHVLVNQPWTLFGVLSQQGTPRVWGAKATSQLNNEFAYGIQ